MSWLYKGPNGELRGPVASVVLIRLLREGKLSPQTFIAREGTDKWDYPAAYEELSWLDAPKDSSPDAARTSSTLLPDVIRMVAILALVAGVAGLLIALQDNALWLLTPALTSLLSAPFLYGFADIVLSLRKLCAKE